MNIIDNENITTAPTETAPKTAPKKRTVKTETAPINYQSFTDGKSAHPVDPKTLKSLNIQYPFFPQFLSETGYNAALEIKIFISHDVKTDDGKTRRVKNFYRFAGTNKIKKYERPAALILTPQNAAKTFPALSPLTGFNNLIVYITIVTKSPGFRFDISYKN